MENTTNSIILANACYSLGISATFYISFFSTLVFIAITFKSRFQVNENLKECSLPPGPKPWLIVGSLPEMLRNKPTFRWIHELMNDMNTEIACIRLGCIHVIAVSCPAMSAVSCPARHRLFHATRIEEADHLIRYVYNQCKNNYEDGGLVNVRVASQQFCGNVIRKMVFNKRFFGKGMADGGPGLEEVEHVHALFTVLQFLNSFCVTDYVPIWRWKLDLDGHEKVMKKAIGIIEKYHDPLIEERVRQWRDGLKKDVEDVLDILITLKDGNGNPLLSTKEVTAQITMEVIKRKPFCFSMKGYRNTVIGVEWWVTLFENVCRIRTFEFNRDVSILRYGAWLRASSPVKGRPSWPSRQNQSPPSQETTTLALWCCHMLKSIRKGSHLFSTAKNKLLYHQFSIDVDDVIGWSRDFLRDFQNANLKDVEYRGLCRGGCIGLLLNRVDLR
ncbi:hypothetical protein JRO89_XS09G0015800 [Xanthoceras sorbifolium]|uniref:Cytochrome P450 n=1 Tax=Xanthoceras sorbifolium TaxID=99658 RepID=A0ABQ8HK55_9ROSI|nr:hypothetical protein JRO89_XS09G0015800 [Xanthoceras sorbifolium]